MSPLAALRFTRLRLSLSPFVRLLMLIKDKERHLLLMRPLMKQGRLLSGTKVPTN